MALMSPNQCFKIMVHVHVKFLLMHKNGIMAQIFPQRVSSPHPPPPPLESYFWTLKPANSHSLGIFSSTVYFSSVDLRVGVRMRFGEMSAYRRLKMWSLSREIAGTAVWCLVMEGVRLRV